jgi:uncharacterized membrane protein
MHPFLWEAGAMYDLGVPAGSDLVQAMDVNDGTPRRVVGGPANPIDRAVVWTVSGTGTGFSATATVLDGISTSGSFAFALNDAGVVVGYSKNVAGTNFPAVWSNPPTWSPSALSLLTNASSGIAYDINSAGKIVGFNALATAGCSRAVVWGSTSDAASELPMLSGGTCAEAWAINDAGQISGFSTNRSGGRRAVLWQWQPLTTGYSVSDLGAIRGTIPQVLGINEPLANGTGVEVVGYGFARNGAERATLWTLP